MNNTNAHCPQSDKHILAAGSVNGWFILSRKTTKQEDSSAAFIKESKKQTETE